ncbi:hypothetical protein [Candidatus Frankia alpina]|uniref:hypothetical protein n=1 Tax=Candidatus Frankia alpina TaxID=2699483 RepID=UPI0013D55F47|nr:hypothetical protein [Candidatus Frankia alpina]
MGRMRLQGPLVQRRRVGTRAARTSALAALLRPRAALLARRAARRGAASGFADASRAVLHWLRACDTATDATAR